MAESTYLELAVFQRFEEALPAAVADITGYASLPVFHWMVYANAAPYLKIRVGDQADDLFTEGRTEYTMRVVGRFVVGHLAGEYSGSTKADAEAVYKIMSDIRDYFGDRSNRDLITSSYTTRPTWLRGDGARIARSTGLGYFPHPSRNVATVEVGVEYTYEMSVHKY